VTRLPRRAALAAALSLPGALAASGPDAEILRLAKRIVSVEAVNAELWTPYNEVVGGPPKAIRDHSRALTQEYLGLMCEIGHMRATTPEGLRAKARAAMTKVFLNEDLTVDEDDDDFIMWSLCRDLIGGAA